MQILLSLVCLAALLAAILGLIKPAMVLFFVKPEKQTRLKAFGLYAGVFVLGILLLPTVTKPDTSDKYLAQLKEDAKQTEQAQTQPPKTEMKKATPEQIAADRETVRGLYSQLMQFKDDTEFHQKGFGAGLPYAHKWLQNVKEVDSRMSLKKGYSLALASSAGYLQQLGKEYIRSHGQENQQTRDFRKFVEEGLNK